MLICWGPLAARREAGARHREGRRTNGRRRLGRPENGCLVAVTAASVGLGEGLIAVTQAADLLVEAIKDTRTMYEAARLTLFPVLLSTRFPFSAQPRCCVAPTSSVIPLSFFGPAFRHSSFGFRDVCALHPPNIARALPRNSLGIQTLPSFLPLLLVTSGSSHWFDIPRSGPSRFSVRLCLVCVPACVVYERGGRHGEGLVSTPKGVSSGVMSEHV